MPWSLLIKNGTVVDGSGAPGVVADVALEGDRIAAIGPNLAGEAARTIDAKGLMVAPGFIDIHSHSDLVYDKCPGAESKVRQGVTTEVVGMCGFSPGPIAPGRADAVRDWIGGIGNKPPATWHSFGEYLDFLRGLGTSVNVVQFVGHGALRLATVGGDNRPATADEQQQMERLLAEGLDAGAWGYSTGLVYAPSVYGSTEELIALAKSMATRGGLYFSHVRGEAGTLEKAYEEAIRIGEPLEKLRGPPVVHPGRQEIVHLGAARWVGIDVAGHVHAAGPGVRAIADCLIGGERWGSSSGSYGWDEVMVATSSRPELAGKNLAELARLTGKEPAHAMMDLVLSEHAGVSMVGFSQSEENVAIASADPHTMIGSDSLSLHSGPGPHPGKPHPRSYGTFPRVLGVYCREKRLFSWETAVHKMTGMPAGKLRLKDRGLVKAGFAADLALFDPKTVRDEATFPDPHRHPAGIPYVVVNGQVVVDGPRYNAVPAGRVLTR